MIRGLKHFFQHHILYLCKHGGQSVLAGMAVVCQTGTFITFCAQSSACRILFCCLCALMPMACPNHMGCGFCSFQSFYCKLCRSYLALTSVFRLLCAPLHPFVFVGASVCVRF